MSLPRSRHGRLAQVQHSGALQPAAWREVADRELRSAVLSPPPQLSGKQVARFLASYNVLQKAHMDALKSRQGKAAKEALGSRPLPAKQAKP